MPIIGTVIAAVASFGATAGVAVGVGATIGSAIAVGVVTGAVIGAATALVTGGNVFEGALRGALIGGVTAGVLSSIGAAADAAAGIATGQAATNASTTAALQGPNAALFSSTAAPASVTASNAAAAGTISTATPGYSSGSLAIPNGTTSSGGIPNPPAPPRSTLNKLVFDKEGAINDSFGMIASGVVSGGAQALLTETPEAPESQSEYLTQMQALNVSGDFNTRVANIKIPDAWTRISPATVSQAQAPTSLQQQPLTPQQLAVLNAQRAEGESYARPV